MTRLEELRQQKKQIEAEIKQLTNQTTTVGRCKFHMEHYGTCRPDEYVISYKSRSQSYPTEERNKRLIVHSEKQVIVKQLDEMISDLKALKKEICKDDDVNEPSTQDLFEEFKNGGNCNNCDSLSCQQTLGWAVTCKKFIDWLGEQK